MEVGIRELRAGLSRWLDRVRAGEELIVTDRGAPVARVTPIDQPRPLRPLGRRRPGHAGCSTR